MSRSAWSTLVATAAVAVLAALVVLTGTGPPPVTRGELVPGLAVGAVTRLELRRGDRAVVVDVARGVVTAPTAGQADPAAVADLLSSLASARVDRRGGAPIAAPRATIALDVGRALTVTLGDEVAATGQAWVAVDGQVALVPGWVGRALDRDPDQLRQRRLVAPGAEPIALDVHVGRELDLVLAGPALVRRDGDGRSTRLALEVRRALWTAVAALRLEQFGPPADPAAPPAGTVDVRVGTRPIELRWFGPCAAPGLVQVATTIGDGCVAQAAIDAVIAAARVAATDAGIAATPLVTAAPVVALELPGGVRVRQDGGGWLIEAAAGRWDADADRVRDLLTLLAAPAQRRARTADDQGGAAWAVIDASGERQAWRVRVAGAAATIVRGDEAVALELAPAAAAAVAAGALGLRDRQPLRLDPTQVARVRATGLAPATIVRGAVLGEWQVDAPAGAAATAAAAALPAALAGLQVDRWAAPAALGRVRRTLTVARDAEGPLSVAIGAADAAGCWIAVDAAAAGHASAAACAALLAPLAAR